MKINLRGIYGVKFSIHNPYNENFSQGSILISNHQSILDPILMLSLSPHILVLISEKVWNNPIVHPIFKLAGFICLNQPMDTLKNEIAKAINKGFNIVIFPEGKRNEDQISRFHQGAFHIAREIDADILPVYLHGVDFVMPKGSGFARRGQIDIEIGQRISVGQLNNFGATDQLVAQYFHHAYIEHYEQLKRTIRNTHFFHHHIIYQYIYKGVDIERETRYLLRHNDDFSGHIDGYMTPSDSSNTITINEGGHGQLPMLFALVHPELNIHYYVSDADDAALISACSAIPKNLHIHQTGNNNHKI